MLQCHQELTLKDALSDSLIRTVMAADGVDPRELEATLTEIARHQGRLAPPAVGAERWRPAITKSIGKVEPVRLPWNRDRLHSN